MNELPGGFETERLTLRAIAPDDAPAIFARYAQDPEVVRYLIWRPHRSLEDTEAYIASCLAASPRHSRTFVLVDRAEGGLLGAFHLRRPEPHRLDCGYVLAQPFWGRGLMTEALAEVARWALTAPGIWRIGAVCDVDNRASARVMEKAGLAREGDAHRQAYGPVHRRLGLAARQIDDEGAQIVACRTAQARPRARDLYGAFRPNNIARWRKSCRRIGRSDTGLGLGTITR